MPEGALDAIVADMDGLYRKPPYEEGGVVTSASASRTPGRSAQRQAARAGAPVLAMLEELYGRKPLPFQTLNFPGARSRPPTRHDPLQLDAGGLHVRRVGRARGHGHGQRAARLLPGQPQASRRSRCRTSASRPSWENYRHYERVHRRPDRARGARAARTGRSRRARRSSGPPTCSTAAPRRATPTAPATAR